MCFKNGRGKRRRCEPLNKTTVGARFGRRSESRTQRERLEGFWGLTLSCIMAISNADLAFMMLKDENKNLERALMVLQYDDNGSRERIKELLRETGKSWRKSATRMMWWWSTWNDKINLLLIWKRRETVGRKTRELRTRRIQEMAIQS